MELTGRIKLYRKDFDGKPVYSRSIASKKYENGQIIDEWQRVYQRVQMPKGTDIPDGTFINVKHGFEAVYTGQNGQPLVKLVVMKYELEEPEQAEQAEQETQVEGFSKIEDEDIPF